MYYIRKQADLIKINTISDLIRVYIVFLNFFDYISAQHNRWYEHKI